MASGCRLRGEIIKIEDPAVLVATEKGPLRCPIDLLKVDVEGRSWT